MPEARPLPARTLPKWRVGKPDAILAQAVDVAREALSDLAKPEAVGEHMGAKSEGERSATHLFTCLLTGYRGWQWFVVVARAPRSKVVTVSEVGLLPTEQAVLAPEWLPWAKRVRPEDEQAFNEGASQDATVPGETHTQADEAEPEKDAESVSEGVEPDADVDADDVQSKPVRVRRKRATPRRGRALRNR